MTVKLVAVLLCTTFYTFVRYVVFGDVSPIHLPVYLLNKSVSMASVVFLSFAAYSYLKQNTDRLRFWGAASFQCMIVHVLLSLSILSSSYYSKFFGAEKMNLTGELTMMLGVLATYCFYLARRSGTGQPRGRMVPLLTSLFLIGHLVAMGWRGWLNVAKWHGGLPPISLVSLVFAVASLAFFFRTGGKQFR